MENKTFYITTPIYYPSNKLHIGNSYTTVAADTMARYKKLRGFDVKFLTGTDEHGQKIERIAEENNTTPIEYVDGIVAWIKDLWKLMDIDYDQFIRTTDDYHVKTVQKIFKQLYDQGDIYKDSYEGLYCVPCETFFTEKELVDGKCPDCGRKVETVKEDAYFFKLSKYQDRIIEHIEKNPEFLQPQSRQNEMLNNFLRPGLKDLCVSRTSFKWGVPVTFDEKHVVYVWVDALSNYITALGYGTENEEEYKKYWPADIHLVGKDILRFHTIIWPALLMALELPLPKQVFGHGWLVMKDCKMSKSKGNVVDPTVLVGKYGSDAIRYFLMREIVFGQDGVFNNEALITRMNSDLANDLGNLVSRTVAMILKYYDGTLIEEREATEFDESLETLAAESVKNMEGYMEKLFFSDALEEVWKLVRRTNKYIDETSPWILAKDEANNKKLANVLYHLTESLRMVSIMIQPFMPRTPKIMREQLGIIDDSLTTWESLSAWGAMPATFTVKKGEVMFPRIDMKVELEQLEKELQAARDQNKKEQPKDEKPKEVKEKAPEIEFDDFMKVEMKVGEVLECEKIKKSSKLLKSQVKIGDEVRQIVSGIAKNYKPEEMVGKKVIVVTNLKPVKLCGELSEGMILAASDDEGNLSLGTIDKDIESGSEVR